MNGGDCPFKEPVVSPQLTSVTAVYGARFGVVTHQFGWRHPYQGGPVSTNAVDAPARGLADRWPFRRKLNVLVGVPLAVIAVLLSYLITDLVQQSGSARSAARLVRDSAQVAQLVNLVEA